MVRFSLSPKKSPAIGSSRPWDYRGRPEHDKSDDDYDDSSTDASEESVHPQNHCSGEESDSSEDEEEPMHPLGFPPRYGRTRFSLTPSHTAIVSTALIPQKVDHDDDVTYQKLDEWWEDATEQSCPQSKSSSSIINHVNSHNHYASQSYPPLTTLVPSKTANMSTLMRHDLRVRVENKGDEQVDRVAELIRASLHIQPLSSKQIEEAMQVPNQDKMYRVGHRMTALAAAASQELDAIQRNMQQERQRIQQEQQAASKLLQNMLQRNETEARRILQREELEREEEETEQAEKLAATEKAAAEEADKADKLKTRLATEKAAAEEAAKADKLKTKLAAEEAAAVKAEILAVENAAAMEAAKAKDYIGRADKLVTKLVELRASLGAFETSKEVSKRRLGMKKVVRGKLNTLAHDASKIQSVASEISQAISDARQEDEVVKHQIQASGGSSSGLARGKRYLVDLLASNLIIRVQAEGFNGTRGDGFPLAAMLAAVSTEAKELIPILAAHIYTVCPTVIPKLPAPAKDSSETELMESLGMIKTKTGDFETFDRFLARTEGLVSITAAIMSSSPPNHVLMGGHKGASEWLDRFFDLLPPVPQLLPLLTAPVLVAFITGAGHMLANKYPDQFQKTLDTINDDLIHRLDESSIGKPSATRLKKLMDGGFEKFKNTMPEGAVKELYDGAPGTGGGVSVQSRASTTPFGSSTGNQSSGGNISQSPFGTTSSAQSSFGSTTAPFGGGTSDGPFGNPSASNSSVNSFSTGSVVPEEMSNSTTSMPNPFGASTNMQQQSSNPSPFGDPNANSSTQTPFGASTVPNPFGNPVAPFGGGGVAPTAPSPFGGAVSSQTSMGGMGIGNAPPNSFGGGATTNPSPFGGGGGTMNPSPFGGGVTTNPSPFGGGVASNPSPFGGSGGGGASNPSPFGGSGGTTVGNDNPFGGSAASGSGFGGFGGGSNKNQPTPFGGGGSGGGGGGRGGGGNGKPPCKFFAQGNCRFGNNCRFSHSSQGANSSNAGNNQPSGGFGTFGTNTNNSFGGGMSNNSPFGR